MLGWSFLPLGNKNNENVKNQLNGTLSKSPINKKYELIYLGNSNKQLYMHFVKVYLFIKKLKKYFAFIIEVTGCAIILLHCTPKY